MGRHFDNTFADYNETSAKLYFDESLKEISDTFKKKAAIYENQCLNKLKRNFQEAIFSNECVFTGSAGIAYLYYLYAKNSTSGNHTMMMDAANYIQIKTSRHPRVSFLCGDAGPLALGAVISHHLGDDRPQKLPAPPILAQQLEQLWSVAEQSTTPDEILYGRAGYLFALLFVNKETGTKYISSDLIKNVIKVMMESGQKLIEKMQLPNAKLFYKWHDSFYLGGAHGIAGILYMFLQAREYIEDDQIENLVQPTLDWLLDQRYESGNLPSSMGSQSDRLVQWCHGAPGLVQLCCLAYEVFKEDKYLDAAILCGEVVWQRGLCTKGYSICHGVAGNAYTFIQLYQTTKDPMHLYRTCCFADWCMDAKQGTEKHSPDTPASLFEGLAGRLYFITDMFSPFNAKFPGFTL